MNIVLIVLLILVLGGGGYGWHSSGYAGGPFVGGGLGLIVIILVLFWAVGRV